MTLWLIVAGVVLLSALAAYFFGRSDGAHGEKLKQVSREIAAAERIRDAAETAPATRDDLMQRLRNDGL